MLQRPFLAAVLVLGLALCLPARPLQAAEDPADGDVRDLKVGVPVSELPQEGYVAFHCASPDGTAGAPLAGFADFMRCPLSEHGWREVTFEYDESRQVWAKVSEQWEGTKIAGHPVRLSLLIDGDGTVQMLRAVTVAERLFMKKKAFLLGVRVMGRYGRDGWACTDRPRGDRSAVGGMFIDRHCEKALDGRLVQFDTALYRTPDQQEPDFTGRTSFEVVYRPAG